MSVLGERDVVLSIPITYHSVSRCSSPASLTELVRISQSYYEMPFILRLNHVVYKTPLTAEAWRGFL